MIHIIENYKIGKILFDSVRTAGIDYLVREKTDTSYLVSETLVRKIREEVDLDKIIACVKLLEPALDVRSQAVIVLQRYVPVLVIDECNRLRKRRLRVIVPRAFAFKQT